MNSRLTLLLQSSSGALSECLATLRGAVELVDEMEAQGERLPFPSKALDRAYAQCLNAHRTLEGMAGKVR